MTKFIAPIVMLIVGIAGFGSLAPSAVNAQGYYRRDDDRYYRRYGEDSDSNYNDGERRQYFGYEGCHDTISATGIGYPLGVGSRHSAIKAWKREAWAAYGRDFSWSGAANRSIECAPYIATIRCRAVARPCS